MRLWKPRTTNPRRMRRAAPRTSSRRGILVTILRRTGAFLIKLGVPLVLLGAGGYMSLTTPYLQVSRVTVQGTRWLSPEEIRQLVALEGRNLLLVSPWEVQAQVERLPQVTQAQVRRRLPNEVLIVVQERQPIVRWQVKEGTYAVAAEGVVLGPASPDLPLLTIRQVDDRPLASGDRVDREAITLAQRLVVLLPQKMGSEAKGFEYKEGAGLVVTNGRGQRARFGDGRDVPYKLAAWKAILAQAPQAKIPTGHVDLRFPTRPFARP